MINPLSFYFWTVVIAATISLPFFLRNCVFFLDGSSPYCPMNLTIEWGIARGCDHFLNCLLKYKLSVLDTATTFQVSCCLGLSFPLCLEKWKWKVICGYHYEKLLKCCMEGAVIAICYSYLTLIIAFWGRDKSDQDFKNLWHYKGLHSWWFRNMMLISCNWIKRM